MKHTIEEEILRMAKLYGKTDLDIARENYDVYVNHILEREDKRNRLFLLNMYDREKYGGGE